MEGHASKNARDWPAQADRKELRQADKQTISLQRRSLASVFACVGSRAPVISPALSRHLMLISTGRRATVDRHAVRFVETELRFD